MVRTNWKWPITLVLGVALALTAAVTWSEARMGRPSLERLQAQLGLSDAQVSAIRQLYEGHREPRHQVRTALHEAQKSLRELVLSGADPAAIQAKTAEIQQLHGQFLQLRIQNLQGLSQILTPEQRQAFAQLRSAGHRRSSPPSMQP